MQGFDDSRCTVAIISLCLGTGLQAQTQLEGVTVIGQSPVHGVGVEVARLPARVQQVTAEQLQDAQSVSLVEFMRDNLSSVTINEAVNNPYQPDLQYRGFTASPLLGLPQGISVYLNGVRFNEPFGDTVNWDLIPMGALQSVNLFSGSNPLFGQNTLGGSLSLQTKNGFNFSENELQLEAGENSYRNAQFQTGGNRDDLAYYLIGNLIEEDGWRDHSPSDLQQLMGVFSQRSDTTQLNLTLAHADNTLIGNGAVPRALMAREGRSAIYTQPDQTETNLALISLDGSHWLRDNIELAGNVYYRSNEIRTLNGDDSDYEECLVAAEETLCDEGDITEPVHFRGFDEADSLEDVLASLGLVGVDADALDGTVNTSRTEQASGGMTLQSTIFSDLAGRSNQLTLGVSYDRAEIEFESDTEFAELANDTPADDRGAEPVGIFDEESRVRLDTEVTHSGLFVSNLYSLTEALDITVGARYNRTKIKMTDQLADGPGSLDGSHEFHRLNPMAGLAYRYSEGLSGYLSYSESSRAPTPAELSCADPNDPCKLPNGFVSDPPLEQVVAKSVEAGLRGGFSSIRWHAGLFSTLNHDDIIFQQAGGLPSEGFFTNVGKTQRQGAELEASTRMGAVELRAAYTYLRATFETPFTSFSPNNPRGGNRQVAKGDRIPGLPEHIFKLGMDWRVTGKLRIGGDVQYRGAQYFRGDEGDQYGVEGHLSAFLFTVQYHLAAVHRRACGGVCGRRSPAASGPLASPVGSAGYVATGRDNRHS